MPTNRTPLRRSPLPQITLRALELFGQMERARRRRRDSTGCRISEFGFCKTDDDSCEACSTWWKLHGELHTELGLRPWQWPAVPECPYPPRSAAAKAWQPEPGS